MFERVEVGEYLAGLLLERRTAAPTSTPPATWDQLEFLGAMAGAFVRARELSKLQGEGLIRGALEPGLLSRRWPLGSSLPTCGTASLVRNSKSAICWMNCFRAATSYQRA